MERDFNKEKINRFMVYAPEWNVGDIVYTIPKDTQEESFAWVVLGVVVKPSPRGRRNSAIHEYTVVYTLLKLTKGFVEDFDINNAEYINANQITSMDGIKDLAALGIYNIRLSSLYGMEPE